MNKKRILSIIIACAVVAGAVIGVPAAVRRTNGRNTRVLVVPASELNYGGGFLGTSEMEGYLTSGKTQSIYASGTEVIKEVHVKAGQQVSKGDLLLTYDETRTSINLELAKLNKEAIELEKETAEKNLATLNKIKPVSESGGGDDPIFPDDVDPEEEFEEEEDLPEEDPDSKKDDEPEITEEDVKARLDKQKAELQDSIQKKLSEKAGAIDPEFGKKVSEAKSLEDAIQLIIERLGTEPAEEEIREAVRQAACDQLKEAFETDDSELYKEIEQAEQIDQIIEILIKRIQEQKKLINPSNTDDDPASSGGDSSGDGDGTPGGDATAARSNQPAGILLQNVVAIRPVGADKSVNLMRSGEALVVPGSGGQSQAVLTEEVASGDEEMEMGGEMPSIGSLISPDETYTKEQLADAKKEQQSILSDCDLNLREAELGIRTAEQAIAKGEVYADMDGVVKKVGDPKAPNMDGTPFLQVSSESGMSAKGGIPELDLDTVKVGDPVTVTSWNTGARYTGEITEISPYPDTSGDFNMWGSSGSYYPFTAVLEDTGDEIEEHEWVQITIGSGGTEDLMGDDAIMAGEDPLEEGSLDGETFTIYRAFIREDEDVPYVYKRGEDGLLVKQVVRLGKLSGESYEIRSGVTKDDYLAFPYGKEVKEGARTREGTMEELASM